MHVLDANELFWITSYTYDRIMEVWWKQWPDAFALYFKLMKQARIQQTNQTYSLNSFLKDGMWWWTDRLRNAKNILKNLWLVDDVNLQDEKWKIIGHYVRVNYLIDEEKVRTAGVTYNVSTCWLWPQMDENHQWTPATCGQTATNALNTKIGNALNTKIENISSKEETEQSSSITKDINNLINELKQECDSLWIAYDKTKERQFAKHILSAKEYGGFCEKIWMWRQEFASNILKASVLINFWKWACAWPMRIYQNYSEVYNKTKELHSKNQKNLIQSF